ncbi:hypothetical protein Tco_0890091 [Tanacetum coccineum]
MIANVNNVNMEHDGAQNDDEDTEHVILENIENEIEGDDTGFQDLNEYEREQNGLVDDENEDPEHIMFGNNQNGIELGSDSENESENEIVERKVNGDGSASTVPREIVKSPTVSLEVEKGQSADMQRDLVANYEMRISELKEDHARELEAMQKKNDDDREN